MVTVDSVAVGGGPDNVHRRSIREKETVEIRRSRQDNLVSRLVQ